MDVSRFVIQQFIDHLGSQLIADCGSFRLRNSERGHDHFQIADSSVSLLSVTQPRNLEELFPTDPISRSKYREWTSDTSPNLAEGQDRLRTPAPTRSLTCINTSQSSPDLLHSDRSEHTNTPREIIECDKSQHIAAWVDGHKCSIAHIIGSKNELLSYSCFDTRSADCELRLLSKESSDGCEQRQVVTSFGSLGFILALEGCTKLLATRSVQSISIYSLDDRNGKLRKIGHVRLEAQVEDMEFCPFSYPELIFCTSDGSVFSVDLTQLESYSSAALEIGSLQLTRLEDIIPKGLRCCRCIYGSGPRQILLSSYDTIYTINVSGDSKSKRAEVLINFEGETVRDISSGLNRNHIAQKPFLLAVLTDKRLCVFDIRTVPDPMITWDLSHSLVKGDTLLFSTEKAQKDQLLGRIVYGSFRDGRFGQALFLTSDAKVGMESNGYELGYTTSAKFSKIGAGCDEHIPVISTRWRTFVGAPSELCQGLRSLDDETHFLGVDIADYSERARQYYPSRKSLIASKAIQKWRAILLNCLDSQGIAVIPPKGDVRPGWLLRVNSVGDLVVQSLMYSKRSARLNGLPPRWRLLKENSKKCNTDGNMTAQGGVVDLDKVDLGLIPGTGSIDNARNLSVALQFRYGIPSFLVSASLRVSMSFSLAKKEILPRNSRYTCIIPPLPMSFHRRHLEKLSHRDSKISAEDWNVDHQRVNDLEIKQGMTLWTCAKVVEHGIGVESIGTKKHKAKDGEFPMSYPRNLARRVDWKLSRERREYIYRSLQLTNLGDTEFVEEGVRQEVESVARCGKCNLGSRRLMLIPSAWTTVGHNPIQSVMKQSHQENQLAGTDSVFLPLRHTADDLELKIEFGDSYFQPCLPKFSEQSEEGIKAIKELMDLWESDWP